MPRSTPRSYLRHSFRPSLARTLKVTLGLSLAATWLLGSPLLTTALDPMQSESYVIQMGNFNMTSGTKSSDSFTLTDTVGELTPGEFNSDGYTVLSGFQYIYALPEFNFRILLIAINLGSQNANTFSTASHELSISTRAGGYTILARAQHELSKASGDVIPFTECDSACTISAAQPWINPYNHGLGFNVSGAHASADFATADYFRPFANADLGEDAQVIAAHSSIVKDDILTVTYQLSVSESQAAGIYGTVVDYTAVPNY